MPFNSLTKVSKPEKPTGLVINGKRVKKVRIRRLTPTECARLQTIPEWYNWDGMSDSQRYKVLGNGWTNRVICHFFSFLPKEWFKKEQVEPTTETTEVSTESNNP